MNKTLLLLFPVLVTGAAPQKAPAFKEGVRLQADGKVIDIKIGHLVPVVTDWNGDGKKDLIVGHFTGRDGNIKLYLNKGTDDEPVLAMGVPLTAGGQPISMAGG